MELSNYIASRTNHSLLIGHTNQWIKLINLYRRDAAAELRSIYLRLVQNDTGSIPSIDLDVTSNDFGILHSLHHVYIYHFDSFQLVHYGNDCRPWPVSDMTLWPWTAAAKEAPRMNRDVWNLIFTWLSPFDVLSVGGVCRQLREYAHDKRAWKHLEGISTNWKFYQKLIKGRNEQSIVTNFLKLICVPYGYGGGNVVFTKIKGSDRVYKIGDLSYTKGFRKRTYRFKYANGISTSGFSVDEMCIQLVAYANLCLGNYKDIPLKFSPIRNWAFFHSALTSNTPTFA